MIRMKKSLALLLVLCLAATVAGCGKADSFTTDLSAFYGDITADEGFPMMMEIDEDIAENFYPGLAAIERKQTVLYTAAISATPCEIAMVEVADPADAKAVEEIFQARIDAQVAGGAWYPDTIAGWENNAVIVTRGGCVCLFVVDPSLGDPAAAFNAL